jgi:hypothetical protein
MLACSWCSGPLVVRIAVVAWLRAVPDEPGLPSAEELAALPHGVLAERLAEAYRVIAQLTAQVREMAARVEEAVAENGRLAARVIAQDWPVTGAPWQDHGLVFAPAIARPLIITTCPAYAGASCPDAS